MAEHRSPEDTVARLCRLVLSLLEATGRTAYDSDVQKLRDSIRSEINAIEGGLHAPR